MAETAALAGFAAGLTLADVPPEVAEIALDHVIDSLGCGLAGAGSSLSRQFLAMLTEEAAPGPCPVFGTALRLAPAPAAFANAVAMNALDFDDGLELEGVGMGHPGATLVAAGLAAATAGPVSGADFLAAMVAGFEINARLIRAIQPSITRFRQVYGVCQHQSLGAAAVFGRAVGLDAAAMENALGFAGTLANVPSLRKYNWEARPLVSFKDFVGPAAESGVRAVRLHEAGLIGARAVLDGESGLWRMLGSDRYAPEILTEGLGRHWSADLATIKPWPTCRWMQATLSSFAGLLGPDTPPEAIARITVHASAGLLRDFMQADPATMVDAQFSLPYALAAMALRLPEPRWYDLTPAERARLDALAARVAGRLDPEADHWMTERRRPSGRVSVTLSDGRVLAPPLVAFPPGSLHHPLPPGFVDAKFLANAAVAMPPEAAAALLSRLRGLRTAPDMRALLGP